MKASSSPSSSSPDFNLELMAFFVLMGIFSLLIMGGHP